MKDTVPFNRPFPTRDVFDTLTGRGLLLVVFHIKIVIQKNVCYNDKTDNTQEVLVMHRFSFRRLPRVVAVLLALLAILSLCACEEGGSLTSEVPRSVFGSSPLERTPVVPDEAPATHAPAFTSGLFEPQQEDDFMPRELSIGELIFSD